jgi:hypothetical protein
MNRLLSNAARGLSVLTVTGGVLMRRMSFLQVAAQMHVRGNGNAHYDERAYAQDQKPPDHPHSRLG